MKIEKEIATKAFESYVDNYDSAAEKIKLKVLHTYRVCELCEIIAKSLKLSEQECNLAWLTGVLHDVGRFEQLRQFNTFVDAISIDHAAFSEKVLFEEGRIRDYIADDSEDTLLRTAVKYHSAYRLPEDLDERTRMFCNILRDADKIDIYRVNLDTPMEEIYNVTTEELAYSKVTEEVMDCIREHHAVLKSLKKTAIDNLAGHIALTFELVYPKSLQLAKEQGYLTKMAAFQSKNPETQAQFQEIRKILDQYIAEQK